VPKDIIYSGTIYRSVIDNLLPPGGLRSDNFAMMNDGAALAVP
jgi:hypothetical protein